MWNEAPFTYADDVMLSANKELDGELIVGETGLLLTVQTQIR